MVTDFSLIQGRIAELKVGAEDQRRQRQRIKAIMDGGVKGIQAVMAWDLGRQMSTQQVMQAYGTDLPTVNLLASGSESLARSVGKMPILKAPHAVDDKVRRKHQKRRDILNGWDDMQRIELQFPQIGRWLPGYSEVVWTFKQDRDPDGDPWPRAVLHDTYGVYTGWWGIDDQPDDIVIEKVVPIRVLKRAYPDINWNRKMEMLKRSRPGSGIRILGQRSSTTRSTFDGDDTGVVVDEYVNHEGTYYVCTELQEVLTFKPNPLSGPPFVAARRPVFSSRINHFHHAIGLMAMMAKLNILGLVVAEDSAFRETNIIGELVGGEYERGRFAQNFFEPGTRIEKPTTDNAVQLYQQIDRLERQIRIGTQYDVSQDGISPNSFATGQAVRELRGGAGRAVAEYQTVIRHAMERIDSKRYEWAEAVWPSRKCKIYSFKTGRAGTYIPNVDIAGVHQTRRIHGAMATWDEPQAVVTGLQLLQAGVLAVEDVQDNLDGLHDAERSMQLNDARKAEDTLFERLKMKTQEDPRADAALAEIVAQPHRKTEILVEYFTPQEEEQREQMTMVPPEQAPQMPAGPRPDVTSIMSRLMGSRAEGGVQTVGTMRR